LATDQARKRFGNTNGWGFFTFGHHPSPYAETAAESSVTECAGCHAANIAKTDMTWIHFYPLLRDKLERCTINICRISRFTKCLIRYIHLAAFEEDINPSFAWTD